MDGEERVEPTKLRTPRRPRALVAPPAVGTDEEERAYACYAIGFGCTPRPHNPLWQLPPVLLQTNRTGMVELLLIARVPLSEALWQTHAAGWIERVQMHELLSTPVQGAACVERFLEQTAHARERERLFDAYRLLSDGRMHPDDDRSWCMTLRAMRALHTEMDALDQHMQGLLKDRAEVARLIEYGEGVLETAQVLAAMTLPILLWEQQMTPEEAAATRAICAQRQWLVEQQQLELRALESKELELLHAIELDRAQLHRWARVRARQEPLRARRRAEAATERRLRRAI